MKAGELLKQIELFLQYKEKSDKKHMPEDNARIRISCEFNKLKVFYDLGSIVPIHFDNGCQVLELSNYSDNCMSLNTLCNELRENSDMDVSFIIYDDESNRITGFGENDNFVININNHVPTTLYVNVEKW